MYVHGFRFYFTPLTGVLFAFPSQYWFTIGQSGVFSLGGWSPHFLVSRPTCCKPCCKLSTTTKTSNTGLSPCVAWLPFFFFFPYSVNLATKYKSLTHYTKGTQSPFRAPTACTYTVSGSISLPSLGFFSPFLHSTGSLSVNQEYLALEDGPPIFKQDFSCPALLVASLVPQHKLKIRGYHPVSLGFPANSSVFAAITCWLFRFRSPLLTKSRLISFPRGT
ncbi:hypothetical protein HPS_1373 [Glaesserella parasuis 29755]|nr:hypothetical protein HPS_1373 [Glaesserella parasuis 29755]